MSNRSNAKRPRGTEGGDGFDAFDDEIVAKLNALNRRTGLVVDDFEPYLVEELRQLNKLSTLRVLERMLTTDKILMAEQMLAAFIFEEKVCTADRIRVARDKTPLAQRDAAWADAERMARERDAAVSDAVRLRLRVESIAAELAKAKDAAKDAAKEAKKEAAKDAAKEATARVAEELLRERRGRAAAEADRDRLQSMRADAMSDAVRLQIQVDRLGEELRNEQRLRAKAASEAAERLRVAQDRRAVAETERDGLQTMCDAAIDARLASEAELARSLRRKGGR